MLDLQFDETAVSLRPRIAGTTSRGEQMFQFLRTFGFETGTGEGNQGVFHLVTIARSGGVQEWAMHFVNFGNTIRLPMDVEAVMAVLSRSILGWAVAAATLPVAVDAHESSLTPWVPRYAPAAIQVSPPLLPKTFAAAHLRMAMREAKAIINTAGDSPGGFYEWFEMQRRDADTGRIPFEKLQAARESALMARGAPGRAPLGGANPIWWPIGPSTIPDGQTDVTAGAALSPVSGRLQAIAVHPTNPDIVYAGGAQGGIWKTTNATAASPAWTPLTDAQVSMATGSIAIDPVNPNIIYVGTGEGAASCDSYYGAGVLRSTDGGQTWQQFGFAEFGGNSIPDIVVDPASAGSTSTTVVYAAVAAAALSSGTSQCIGTAGGAGAGGMYRSTDSGQTWTRLTVPTGVTAAGTQVHDIEVDPASPSTVYVSVRNSGTDATAVGIWKSTNANTPAVVPVFARLSGGFPPSTATAATTSNPGLRRIEFAVGAGAASNVVFAAVADPNSNLFGLFRSADAGATWTHVDNGANGNGTITSTSQFTTSSGSIPASAVGRKLIMRNTVSGRVFARPITAVAGNVITVSTTAAAGGTLVTSADAYTWSVSNYPLFCNGQCSYDMTIAMDPLDATGNTVYVGGNPNAFNGNTAPVACGSPTPTAAACRHSLWRTTDGGVTWRGISQGDGVSGGVHTDDHELVFDPTDVSAPARLYNGNDGGIWSTDNGGTSWKSLNTNLAITQFQSISLHPTDTGVVLGGTQDNGTNILGRGAVAAPAWFHTDFGDGGQSAIDRTNSNIMYHTYFNQSNNFFGPAISTTGGGNGPGNWSDAIGFAGPVACGNGMDITDQVSFYAPLALMRPDVGGVRDIIYFGSDTLYRNANPGPVLDDGMGGCIAPNAWTAVSADLVNGFLSAIATHDVRQGGNEVVYAAASTGAIFTVPTGVAASAACPGAGCPTWVTISAAPLPARFVTDLYVDPTDATGNTVYAAFSGFNGATPGHVFKTTNGRNGAAATWANVSGNLPDVPVNAITFDTVHDVLLAGTDIGVFASADDGATWSELYAGHPNSSVFALEHDASTGQTVSGTHGRGAFELVVPGALAAVGSASPDSVVAGNATLVAVDVTAATFPSSTSILVEVDLTAIGGSATQALLDDGLNGDLVAGDGIYSRTVVVALATPNGPASLPYDVSDAQLRTATGTVALNVVIDGVFSDGFEN